LHHYNIEKKYDNLAVEMLGVVIVKLITFSYDE